MTRSITAALGGITFVLAALPAACFEPEQPAHGKAMWAGVEPVEVAEGRAHRGPWRMNESDFDYVDQPTAAISADGHVAVAWADQSRHDVFFQMYGPDGRERLAAPVNLSASPTTFSWLPRLLIAADDPQRIYALWQEIIFSGGGHGGEMLFARSTDGGRTFGPPINLSNSQAGDGKGRLTLERWDNGSFDLAAGPDGRLYAAWTEYEGPLWLSHSADAGLTFTKPVHVAGDMDQPTRAPALAVERNGTVHLAWSVSAGPSAGSIHLAASSDGGRTFGPPQTIASQGYADAPKIAADARDGLHLVYAESTGGAFQPYSIRYAHRAPGAASFSEARTIAAADAAPGSLHFPDLAIGPADRLHVTWSLFPDYRQRPHGLASTVSNDGGQTFANPEIVPRSNDPRLGFSGSLQGMLTTKLAVNANGAVALVDSTFARGKSSHIWLWRWPPIKR